MRGERRLPRSLLLSAGLMTALLIPLTYYSVLFFTAANENRQINTAVRRQVDALGDADLVEMQVSRSSSELDINLTLRTNQLLRYEQVVMLQQAIVNDLNRPISLKVNQIFAERLDPLLPPTPTPTLTPTLTATPGPSPTLTHTPTATGTATPTRGSAAASRNVCVPPPDSPVTPMASLRTYGRDSTKSRLRMPFHSCRPASVDGSVPSP